MRPIARRPRPALRLRAVLAVAATVAVVVAACGVSGPQFSVTLQSSGEVPPLPIVLTDETGLVTRIEAAPLRDDLGSLDPAVRADPSSPTAFILGWFGGACDNDVALTFKRHENGYVLNVSTHGKLVTGCTAQAIARNVRIVTSSPIPVASIVAAGHT